MKFISIITISLLVLIGCSSLPTDKSDFEKLRSEDLLTGNILVICRPSGIYQAARRPDIFIDGKLTTDIGSGEVIHFDVKEKNNLKLRLELSGYGTQFSSATKMILSLDPHLSNKENYYILSVGLSEILPSTNPSSLAVISSEWSIRKVSKSFFIDKCSNLKTYFFSKK